MSSVCKSCGTLNAVGAKACRECHALLDTETGSVNPETQKRCPRCQGVVLRKLRFCNFCGHDMQMPAEHPPAKKRAEPKRVKQQAGAAVAPVPPPLQEPVVAAAKQPEPVEPPPMNDEDAGEDTVLPVPELLAVPPPVANVSPAAVPTGKSSSQAPTAWLIAGAIVVVGGLAAASFWWLQDSAPAVAMQSEEAASTAVARPAETSAASVPTDILRQSLGQDEEVLSALTPLALEPAVIGATATTVVAVTPSMESGQPAADSPVGATDGLESGDAVDASEQPAAAPSTGGRPARDSLADIRRRNEQLRRELGLQN